jgi:DNA-binding CsgD family transcriptional regulator
VHRGENDAQAVLRDIYEAALLPSLWPEALKRLVTAFGATGALAQMVGADGYSVLASTGYEAAAHDLLYGGWHLRNTRMRRGLALTQTGRRGFITEYMMYAAEELRRDPFEQEYAARHDMEHEAGLVLATHGGSSFVVNTPRSARRGAYSDTELGSMNRLVSGLPAACSFALRLKLTAAGEMLDVLGARGEALALLTASGRILHMTEPFERLAASRSLNRNGHVHAPDPAEDRELEGLVRRAGSWLADPGTQIDPIVIMRQPGAPLVARCLPIVGVARDFLGLARMVMVLDEIVLPKAGVDADLLGRAFALTPAEARLAARLGAGSSLREAADGERIAFETARTRLKAVFAKTGTNRQMELALLVARISGGTGRPDRRT